MTRAWFLKGKTPEVLCPATYEKIGIIGTINMETGQVYSTIADKFNADSFLLFIKSLIPNKDVKNAAQDVMEAIKEAVIVSFSIDILHGKNHGLSILSIIWFRHEHVPDKLPVEYTELDFAKDTQWDEVLDEFASFFNSKAKCKTFRGHNFPLLTKLLSRPIFTRMLNLL